MVRSEISVVVLVYRPFILPSGNKVKIRFGTNRFAVSFRKTCT